MSQTETNKQIARKLYDDWNRRDFDAVAAAAAADAEVTIAGSAARFHGPEGLRAFDESWAAAFPDARVEIVTVIASGTNVAVEYTGSGTHTGTLSTPAGDFPATGRAVKLEICDVLTMRGGKIGEYRMYFDSASLLAQLGLAAAPEPAVTA
jgi:steroid delta-isomerase-like uncharacterized protein